MKKALIYLNIGESAKEGSLVYSQQYENARLIKENNDDFGDVFAVSVLPFKEYIKNKIKRKSGLIEWKGLSIHTYSSGLKIFKLSTFLLKDYLLNRAAKKVIKNISPYDHAIFHCRSYYATALALTIKAMLPEKTIKVVFDMRSFLPEEIAMKSRANRYFYLDYKAWEKKLIEGADVTFATAQRGINIFKMSSPNITVNYLPNCGFESIDGEVSNNVLSDGTTFGYVGSVGPWYDAKKIEIALDFFKAEIDNAETYILNKKLKNIGQHPAFYKPWKEVRNVIKGSLFTLIPGNSKKGYLSELKVSMNFFSTKAAESLSLGIPLVVNRDITEVAHFVEENNCGVVFDIQDNKIVIAEEVKQQLNTIDYWQKLHDNALSAGQKFQRQAIIQTFENTYKSLS